MRRTDLRLSAALVAAVALLAACTDESAGSAGTEPDSPTPSTSSSFTLLSEEPDFETPLAAGSYALTVAEDANPNLPWAVVEAPAGCDNFGTWILECPDEEGDSTVTLGYWSLHSVRHDPCRTASKAVDTVEDAVLALRRQRYSQVSTSDPVTVDGYDGLHVELRIPESVDFAACPQFHPWDLDAAGGLPYYQSPGMRSLWILDIDGDLGVLDVSEAKRLGVALVESLEFVPRTDSSQR